MISTLQIGTGYLTVSIVYFSRAVARIIEHVVRSAGCKFKLCAERTLDISDVIVESSYWATKSKSSVRYHLSRKT